MSRILLRTLYAYSSLLRIESAILSVYSYTLNQCTIYQLPNTMYQVPTLPYSKSLWEKVLENTDYLHKIKGLAAVYENRRLISSIKHARNYPGRASLLPPGQTLIILPKTQPFLGGTMPAENHRVIPLDLKEIYGHGYKIQCDESAPHFGGGRNNPWYYQIPCKYGHIYAYSDRLLAYYCDSGRIQEKLHREHPEIEVCQWGDYEAVFLFPPDQIHTIAKYARPRTKRRLSPEHRQKLANFSFGRHEESEKCRSGERKPTRFRTISTKGVISHGAPTKTRFLAPELNSRSDLRESTID
jgi:hypothetical protein